MSDFSQLKTMLDAINSKYVEGDNVGLYKDPRIKYSIEVYNSPDYGNKDFTSIWFFDEWGNLLGTGAYE